VEMLISNIFELTRIEIPKTNLGFLSSVTVAEFGDYSLQCGQGLIQ